MKKTILLTLALMLISGAEGFADPPVVIDPVLPSRVVVGSTSFVANLDSVFADPDGDVLIYTANSSDASIAVPFIRSDSLYVSPVAGGDVAITVQAQDPGGESVSTTFGVAVNTSPHIRAGIPDTALTVGQPKFRWNLRNVFTDPDEGFKLTYWPSSSDETVAESFVSRDSILVVTPLGDGQAVITVTARDGRDGFFVDAFTVTGNTAPTVIVGGEIPDTVLTTGMEFEWDLDTVFEDSAGDALTYSATSSEVLVATVSISVDGILTVVPTGEGSTTITVEAMDGYGASISTSFNVDVVINDPPQVRAGIPDAARTVGEPFEWDLGTVFEDPDGDALTYSATSSDDAVAGVSVSAGGRHADRRFHSQRTHDHHRGGEGPR